MKTKLCWYCKNVAKCQVLIPCKQFEKWVNPNSVDSFCQRHKLAPTTVYRWLRKSTGYAKQKIKTKLGICVKIALDDDGNWEIIEC